MGCGDEPFIRLLGHEISTRKKLMLHDAKAGAEKHCYECGQQCHRCLELFQRSCSICRGQFCREHDAGCNAKNVSIRITFSVSSLC